jgi:hypothetical protein
MKIPNSSQAGHRHPYEPVSRPNCAPSPNYAQNVYPRLTAFSKANYQLTTYPLIVCPRNPRFRGLFADNFSGDTYSVGSTPQSIREPASANEARSNSIFLELELRPLAGRVSYPLKTLTPSRINSYAGDNHQP